LPLFNRVAELILVDYEGGDTFTHDPHDPGGATRWGISLRFAQDVDLDRDGRPDLDMDNDGDMDRDDILLMTRERAEWALEKLFWTPLHCDEVRGALAIALVDEGFNQGRGAAVVDLQRALGVDPDGRYGPITLAAAKAITDVQLWRFFAERASRYAGTPGFERYGRGWMRRLARTTWVSARVP
jgi:lysozyme family protein